MKKKKKKIVCANVSCQLTAISRNHVAKCMETDRDRDRKKIILKIEMRIRMSEGGGECRLY